MNPILPLGLLAVSAPFGLFLAVRHLRGQEAPLGAAAAHGLFGAAGLGALAWLVRASQQGGKPALALGVLVVAALGGFFLASFRLRSARPGAGLIAVHALAAVTGVLMLAWAAFIR